MSITKLYPVGALIALIAAQPVLASDQFAQISTSEVAVYYGDLNLESPVGAQSLVTRVHTAAKRACGANPSFGPGYRIAKQRYIECVQTAEKGAVAAVNRPNVTAAYAGRKGLATRIATR